MTHLCYIHYARALPAGSPLYTWSAKHALAPQKPGPQPAGAEAEVYNLPYSFESLNDSFGRRPKALVSLLWFLFASLSLFGLSFHRSLLSSLVSFFTSLFSSAVFFFTVLSRWSLPAGFSLCQSLFSPVSLLTGFFFHVSPRRSLLVSLLLYCSLSLVSARWSTS